MKTKEGRKFKKRKEKKRDNVTSLWRVNVGGGIYFVTSFWDQAELYNSTLKMSIYLLNTHYSTFELSFR